MKIKKPARIESLEELMQSITDFAQAADFPGERIQEVALAMEEALTNIFSYAYAEDQNGEVEVHCRMEENSRLLIDIQDSGVPFDILAVPDPDIHSGISERKIGGLGILLIKKMMDEVKYRREGERNILTFVVNRKKG